MTHVGIHFVEECVFMLLLIVIVCTVVELLTNKDSITMPTMKDSKRIKIYETPKYIHF